MNLEKMKFNKVIKIVKIVDVYVPVDVLAIVVTLEVAFQSDQ